MTQRDQSLARQPDFAAPPTCARADAYRHTAAAAARLRLSAWPYIGTATASSASATRSPGRPHASLPKSHAVGSASRFSASSWSSPILALPSAASTASPAARSAETASLAETALASGRWKMEPADDRTHLLLYGSTEAAAKITPRAPAASAVRKTVPALPGSLTLASTTTSRGP